MIIESSKKELSAHIKETKFYKFIYENEKKLIIWGMSNMSKLSVDYILDHPDLYVKLYAIGDNDAANNGQNYKGIPIISINELIDDCGDVKVLIANRYMYSTYSMLEQAGIAAEDIYYPEKYEMMFVQKAFNWLLNPLYVKTFSIWQNVKKIETVYELLEDEQSKKTLNNIIECRLDHNLMKINEVVPENVMGIGYESYFKEEILKLNDHENYIDCGPWLGDSVLEFIRYTEGKYENIYAIEPEASNLSKFSRSIINKDNFKKVFFLNFGVGNKYETVSFDGYTAGKGEKKISIIPMDDFFADKKVSIIKMDIEGMERDALEGATQVIKNQKPRLIISAYHKPADLWELTLFIKELNPEYKIYLRHQCCATETETVIYAI